jgi:hypothetical protein
VAKISVQTKEAPSHTGTYNLLLAFKENMNLPMFVGVIAENVVNLWDEMT